MSMVSVASCSGRRICVGFVCPVALVGTLLVSSWNGGLRVGSGSLRRLRAEDAPVQNVTGSDEVDLVVLQQLSERIDTFPDVSTGMDVEGPYDEEPTEEQMAHPLKSKKDWQGNRTDMDADLGAFSASTWGDSFCESHHTGSFCEGTTQVRCCRKSWGYVKCGSTWHSGTCGYGGGGSGGGYGGGGYGGGWHIHQGWHQSSFCESHHSGFFCFSHKKVHCCNDYGHYVECTTRSESSYRC